MLKNQLCPSSVKVSSFSFNPWSSHHPQGSFYLIRTIQQHHLMHFYHEIRMYVGALLIARIHFKSWENSLRFFFRDARFDWIIILNWKFCWADSGDQSLDYQFLLRSGVWHIKIRGGGGWRGGGISRSNIYWKCYYVSTLIAVYIFFIHGFTFTRIISLFS